MFSAIIGYAQWKIIIDSYDRLCREMVINGRIDLQTFLKYMEPKLNNISDMITHIRKTPALSGNNNDRLTRHLVDALGSMPFVTALTLTDTQGYFYRVPFVPLDNNIRQPQIFKTQPWFITASDDPTTIKYTRSYIHTLTGQKTFSLSKRIPSDGDNYNVLTLDVDVDALIHAQERMIKTLSGQVMVIHQDGSFIMSEGEHWHSLKPALLAKMRAPSGMVDDDENHRRIFYSKILHPSWTVLMVVDFDTLYSAGLKECSFTLTVMLVTLIILCLAWWTSRNNLQNLHFRLKNRQQAGSDNDASIDKLLEKELQKSANELVSFSHTARTDGLTGLFNRRAFDDDLAAQIISGTSSLLLALIDLDNFKSINDEFGHPVGDTVLREFARIAREIINEPGMYVYRFGGEEFAILFCEVSEERAKERLEQFRISFSQHTWQAPLCQVTLSAGLQKWKGETANMLITHVDNSLYEAKKQGKNRIIAYRVSHQEEQK